MKRISGNTNIIIQKAECQENEIGEIVQQWSDIATPRGYLDMASGTSSHRTYNAKVIESDYVFICDYDELMDIFPSPISKTKGYRVLDRADNIYEIKFIDNPMGLGYQFEIYLKFVGN